MGTGDNLPPDYVPGTEGEPAPGLASSGPVLDAAAAPRQSPAPAQPELPEDLRAPWGWTDLVIFFFFALGSMFALLFVLADVVVNLGLVERSQVMQMATKPAFALIHQALWSVVLVLYMAGMVRFRFHMPFWRTIGFRPYSVGTLGTGTTSLLFLLGGPVLAVLILGTGRFVSTPTKLPIEQMFQGRTVVMMLAAYGILVAPLVEEVIFRGYIYPVMARSFGVGAGVIVTGSMFGLMHAFQLWGGWGQIALLMVVGLVLTYVRARTGTVLTSYLLHLGYNTFLFGGFYLVTQGFQNLPTPGQ